MQAEVEERILRDYPPGKRNERGTEEEQMEGVEPRRKGREEEFGVKVHGR